LIVFFCCARLVKTDLDDYLQNKSYYKGKHVVITTDFKNILQRYELYKGKEVELTAPVTYFGDRGFRTWYLFLERDGQKIRCYEQDYRLSPGWDAVSLLNFAKSDGGEITVRGRVTQDGIELNRITCKERTVNTNSKPPEYRIPSGGL